MSGQLWVVLTPVIVWLGVFAYMASVDRRLAAVEAALDRSDT